MSGRRHNGKLRKLRDDGQARAKTKKGLVVAHSMEDVKTKTGVPRPRARTYRYGDNKVIWQGGRFTIVPVYDVAFIKELAPCPKGLRMRVRKALEQGNNHG